MSDAEPGLRERKRRATRLAIQQAALRIAIEEGLAAVTVDEISRRADVSPRTFFNYFPNKEGAILGDDPTLPDDDTLADFVAGGPTGDLLADLGALLVHSTRELIEERGLIEERQQVLRAAPELFSRRMESMKEFQAAIEGAVVARFAAAADGAPDAYGETPERRRRARLASLVALAALRHAWWEWSDAGSDTHLVDELERSFADLDALVSRSLV
ncbi:TetR/AcrR family transcriptional regulator [Curtobacterium sp. NPDC086286]|uniref:TetR/AcrR family transcriptional regulator n=1 Tax=Curtobacterium sp. NPDC086286 TaxID=3363964 RepID=UPI00381DED74